MTRRNLMYYLADFARPQGAKDKEPRKRRGTLGNLAIGTGIGALGGLGAGGYLSNRFMNDDLLEASRIHFYPNLQRQKILKELKKDLKKMPVESKKVVYGEMNKARLQYLSELAPSTIAKGAGLGLLGTGAYLGGKALLNKRNNKSSSPQN